MQGRRVLLGVSGGIGAYKAAVLARGLVAAGATVDVVLTRGAREFVGAATFEGITGRRVRTEVWEDVADGTHVDLGRAADVLVVYPATAHTLARLAQGLADDLLTTAALAHRGPVVLAPAMHTEMWDHAATVTNVATLRSRGAVLVGPEDGPLMGGDAGPGRLADPEDVLVANDVAVPGIGFDSDENAVLILDRAGGERAVARAPKAVVADAVLDALVPLLPARSGEHPGAVAGLG